MSGLKKEEIKIEPVSLRNLDLLSGLQCSDRSYLNRVKLLAKWVQRNQWNLPFRQILERYPRCYCDFNPSSQQQPSDSAAQISGIIRDGIHYFRSMAPLKPQTIKLPNKIIGKYPNDFLAEARKK